MKMVVWILAGIIVVLAALLIYNRFFSIPDKVVTHQPRKEYNILTFRIPKSLDMAVSGPPIWEAKKALNEFIPCSICRSKAVPLGIFEHDVVNGIIDKKVFPFDKANWKLWVNKINELDKKIPA